VSVPVLVFMTLCLNALPATMRVRAQDLAAATRPAPGLTVLLKWGADTTGTAPVRYNMYRKLAGAADYPVAPLNGAPIGAMTDTVQFTSVIPRDSEDWIAIAHALADSVGGTKPIRPLTDVFSITGFPVGTARWRRVQALVAVRPAVALVMGQSLIDRCCERTAYKYTAARRRGEASSGHERGDDHGRCPETIVTKRACRHRGYDASDSLEQARLVSAFDILRSTNSGPFLKVSDVDFSADLSLDLDSIPSTGRKRLPDCSGGFGQPGAADCSGKQYTFTDRPMEPPVGTGWY
jgi:hypothetical protein